MEQAQAGTSNMRELSPVRILGREWRFGRLGKGAMTNEELRKTRTDVIHLAGPHSSGVAYK